MELRKNIVSVTTDREGNVTDEVADYIGVEAFAQSIYELYKECLDNFDNKDELEQHANDLYDCDNYLLWSANEFAYQANEDMKNYLHEKSHHMDGNFANIDDEYPEYRTGTMWVSEYDGDMKEFFDLVPDMIKRLDNAEDSERADDDRKFLAGWFFYAFGTYNIKYNFSNDLQELSYDLDDYLEATA